MKDDLHHVFDFITAEDGDIMLLIQKVEGEPESPAFELDKQEKSLWLHRGPNTSIELQDIDEEIMGKLLNMNKILVCEMNAVPSVENPDPEYIYEAVKL